ncbi:MAG: polymer-forming cytoskeletal protein [Polyangiaceae bacterium]
MASQSVIGAGTTIRGTIRGDVDIEILGSVEGSVLVQGEVIIGETALIKSDVRARRVIVRGAVRGNVSADGSPFRSPAPASSAISRSPRSAFAPGPREGSRLHRRPSPSRSALEARCRRRQGPSCPRRSSCLAPPPPLPAPARPAPAPARTAPAPAPATVARKAPSAAPRHRGRPRARAHARSRSLVVPAIPRAAPPPARRASSSPRSCSLTTATHDCHSRLPFSPPAHSAYAALPGKALSP